MQRADRDRVLASRIQMGLYFLLSGDREPAERFIGGKNGLAPLQEVLETVPPVVNVDFEELRALVMSANVLEEGALSVPLHDSAGSPCVLIHLDWIAADDVVPAIPEFEVRLIGVERHEGAPQQPARSPDDEGRLPREQFVGSPALRLARLFSAIPGRFETLDGGPGNDREAAFLLQFADGDIYNGGLHQFYANSTGNFAAHFADFANRIGAVRKSAVVRRANQLFEGTDLGDRSARNARLDALTPDQEDLLEQLTGEYYDVEEDIDALLVAFIEQDPEAFLC